jgi:hypothetical protein
MRTTITIITTLAALIIAAPANAMSATTPPKIHSPSVTLNQAQQLVLETSYDLQQGDAATITYTIKRHRISRAGFKVVGTITHIVTSGDGNDGVTVKWGRIGGFQPGFGYRILPRIVDVSNALSDTAHAAKLHL